MGGELANRGLQIFSFFHFWACVVLYSPTPFEVMYDHTLANEMSAEVPEMAYILLQREPFFDPVRQFTFCSLSQVMEVHVEMKPVSTWIHNEEKKISRFLPL